jgi:O-antigen ligase
MVVVGRLPEIFPVLAGLPTAKVLIVLAIAAAVLGGYRTGAALFHSSIARACALLFSIAAISVPLSIWRGHSLDLFAGTALLTAITFVLVYRTTMGPGGLARTGYALAGAAVLLVCGGLVHGRTGRLQFGATYDPNDLAFVLCMLLPILFWTMHQSAHRIVRIGWMLMIVAAVWVVLLTQSRGGLLALAAVVGTLVVTGLMFRIPLRNGNGRRSRLVLAGVVVIAMAAPIVWNALPEDARIRLATVTDVKEDYNVTEDQVGRLSIWKRGMAALGERPWGVGLGAFQAAEMAQGGQFRTAHNSFVQIAVELGVVGLAVFALLLVRTFRRLGAGLPAGTIQLQGVNLREGGDPANLLRYLRVSLVAYVVGGFFLSQAYAPLLYVLFAIAASCELLARQQSPARRGGFMAQAAESDDPGYGPSPNR